MFLPTILTPDHVDLILTNKHYEVDRPFHILSLKELWIFVGDKLIFFRPLYVFELCNCCDFFITQHIIYKDFDKISDSLYSKHSEIQTQIV